MSVIKSNVIDVDYNEYCFYFDGREKKQVCDLSRYIPQIPVGNVGKGAQDYTYFTDFENIMILKLEFNLIYLEKRDAQELFKGKYNKTIEEKLVFQVIQNNKWVSGILKDIMDLYYNIPPYFNEVFGTINGYKERGVKSGRTLKECFYNAFNAAKTKGKIYDIIMKSVNPLGLVVKIVDKNLKKDKIKDKIIYNKNL